MTVGALAATGYARVLGQRLMEHDGGHAEFSGTAGEPVEARDAVTPAASTPPEVEKAQKQLKVLQWLVPLLTGALLFINAEMGEQQRATAVAGGVLRRLTPGQ
ncbi:MAG: hypothetical protein M3O86_00670 [Actinomycetota bacterium]|nr:hypothetical protein [Actinomycetota bacterium]